MTYTHSITQLEIALEIAKNNQAVANAEGRVGESKDYQEKIDDYECALGHLRCRQDLEDQVPGCNEPGEEGDDEGGATGGAATE